MILYRAMCNEEANDMIKFKSLTFKNRFKWFGTEEFVNSRVRDGHFNNSKYVSGRYSRLFKFDVADESMAYFSKCGHKEFMIDRRKVPLIKINSFEEIS